MNGDHIKVAAVGAGRMGRGIALHYAFTGIPVSLVDLKPRSEDDLARLEQASLEEIRRDLAFMVKAGLLAPDRVDRVCSRIRFVGLSQAPEALAEAGLIYEAVPERMDAKQESFTLISQYAAETAVIASTTSTFLVTDLAQWVTRPERFLNAHWLNPAHLMPLVELSRSETTADDVVAWLKQNLEQAGKVPVVCNNSPGYIVPRIQSLAMNEAARLVEEGVASAEDIDKAIRVGFGPRFTVLGLLEFIDWGGGDILYYASKYLSQTLDPRFAPAQVIADNMARERRGIRDGEGFYQYDEAALDSYRQERLMAFSELLKSRDLLPQEGQAAREA